ncbi:TPA: restriction endonuclease subunit S [Campylobacter jejuni]|nr:restriction endonuclease subunit S [Campylobacter jejuni]HDZ5083863.1 restriction endonuclease subunit S [Campylobacter jejuni]HDZ5086549.1 restriction endonuclease subunit S [Campylobacter jejuni]
MKNFKDSGIEWLGEIPEHWEVVPIRCCFGEFNIRCNDNDYPLLSVTIANGVVYQNDITDKKDISNDDKSNYKIVPLGAIAYNKMRMWQGAVGINMLEKGIVSPAYVVAIPNKQINISFSYYLLKSRNIIGEYEKNSYGLCSDMNNLRYEDFQNIKIPLPPLKEQEQIVNFLDEKCEQITNFIEKKEKLISLLKEQKQALINETITKGLNKNVNFKDSGIEWLGEIPQHWGINKLKFIAYVKGRIGFHGLNSKEFQYSKGAHLVTGNDFDNNEVAWDRCRRINEERFYEDPNIHLQNNDLLVTKDGTIGKTAIVRNCPNQATLNSGIFLVRVMEKLCLVKYLFYIINSQYFKEFVISKTCGSTIKHLYQSDFHEFKIPLPPLKEQEQIANFLDKKCEKIDLLIEKTKKQIELIKEYKTTLINQAVCGKISL